jgi:hypothetical protein
MLIREDKIILKYVKKQERKRGREGERERGREKDET